MFRLANEFALVRLVFYNLRVGRSARRVRLELRVLAALFRPAVLCGSEGLGYDLRPIRGYVLLRDRSKQSRANIFAYVKANRRLRNVRWHDLVETWMRTEHPGVHPPRSFLEFLVEGIRVIVLHQAPVTRTRDSGPSRREGIELVIDRMAPEQREHFADRTVDGQMIARIRPEVAIGDWNAVATTNGPSPQDVVDAVGGRIAGHTIDAAVVRNAEPVKVRYVKQTTWAGLLFRFLTDHPWGALIVDLRVNRAWWPRPSDPE